MNQDDITISQIGLIDLFTKIGAELQTHKEITICGGSSIVLAHGFRNSTHDVDCIQCDSEVLNIADKISKNYDSLDNWLSTDVCVTPSYSEELLRWRILYNDFDNLSVYLIAGPALLCMKLRAFRSNSNDYDDCINLIDYCLRHSYSCRNIQTIYKSIYPTDGSMSVDAERLLITKGNSAIYSLDIESINSYIDMLDNYVISPSEIPALFRRDIIEVYRKVNRNVDRVQTTLESMAGDLTYFDIYKFLPKSMNVDDVKPFVVQAIDVLKKEAL